MKNSEGREMTDLEIAEAEIDELSGERDDLASQLAKAEAELMQYIGWKTSAQLESQRAEKAEAALAERDTPCAFEQEDESSCVWYTDCGGAYWLEDGGPDQHYKFCPECGHPFIVRIGAPPSDNESLTIGVYHVDIPLYTNEGACYGSRLLFEGSLDDCMGHGGDGRRICNSADNPMYFYDSNSGTWEPSDWEPSHNDLLSPDAGTEAGAA